MFTCVPHLETPPTSQPHIIPLGHPSAPAPSIQYRASNLDWQLVSYMILYIFQCLSPKSSHPRPNKLFICSSVAQLCPTLCNPMNCSMPGLPVHHQLPESTQTHVHWVSDAIQPSHPLLSPSPPAPNLSQHEGLFQWVNSSHEVAKVLEFQLQHQSFQWRSMSRLYIVTLLI